MATAEGLNVKEGKDLVTLKQLERGYVPCTISLHIDAQDTAINTFYDFAEYTGGHFALGRNYEVL